MIERNIVAGIPLILQYMSAWKSTLSTIIYKVRILLCAKKYFVIFNNYLYRSHMRLSAGCSHHASELYHRSVDVGLEFL